MKTERLKVDPLVPGSDAIAHAAVILRAGGLVAFPTETVYGLGAHALDAQAVARIFAAKGRPAHDPLIVHLASAGMLGQVAVAVPRRAYMLMQHFWPGPLTLVLPRHPAVPDAVTAGGPTVAVRVPNHPVALALLQASGLPIAAPSANLFSHTSPTTADHVLADLDGRVDLVLDGGPTLIGLESTVLDVTGLDRGLPAVVLRPGGVTLEALQALLGMDAVRERAAGIGPRTGAGDEGSQPLASPGLLDRHYAPRTPLHLFVGPPDVARDTLIAAADAELAAGGRPVLLAYDEDRAALETLVARGCPLLGLGSTEDAGEVAQNLYGVLRAADGERGSLLLARDLPGGGLAAAVRDRLRRAADRLVLAAPV